MKKEYELKYHRSEANAWWFIARRDIIVRLVFSVPRSARILDVGCSSGVLVKKLKHEGFSDVVGIDISREAIQQCKKNNIDNTFVMDAARTTFADNSFDIIIASDILEHIKNDEGALHEWHRILKPNGVCIVFVPAFQFLRSAHDKANQHHRRYSRRELVERLYRAHFQIERSSYWNCILFFPILLFRLVSRFINVNNKKTNDQLYEMPLFVNNVLVALLANENRILNFLNFPIGVSVFAVCRKTLETE